MSDTKRTIEEIARDALQRAYIWLDEKGEPPAATVEIMAAEFRAYADALTARAEKAEAEAREAAKHRFECKGRKQSLPEPGECDWPFCDCDKYANKVVDAVSDRAAVATQTEIARLRNEILAELRSTPIELFEGPAMRVGLSIAAKILERGRRLTAREEMNNLSRAMNEWEQENEH